MNIKRIGKISFSVLSAVWLVSIIYLNDKYPDVEWEWENSPEVTLVVVESVAKAITMCNSYSPQFVASMVTEDDAEFEAFFDGINAPFVGNGFTRWVDGQYALNRPELGLSNWQYGRLFGRGGVLSGDSIFTIRTLASQETSQVTRRS